MHITTTPICTTSYKTHEDRPDTAECSTPWFSLEHPQPQFIQAGAALITGVSRETISLYCVYFLVTGCSASSLSEGSALVDPKEVYSIGERPQFTCDGSEEKASGGVRCDELGKWQGSPPICPGMSGPWNDCHLHASTLS